MRPLRIALWHNLHSGGGKRALHEHLRALLERGHHVEVFRPPIPGESDFLPLGDLVREHVVPLPEHGEGEGYLGRILGQAKRLRVMPKALRQHAAECARQIHAGGFDLLFSGACRITYAPTIGRYVNLPKAVYLGEPNRFLYEALPRLPWPSLTPEERRSWKKRLRDRLEVPLLRDLAREELLNARAFDRILVNSRFSRESVKRAYGLESEVCLLGVDTDRFSPSDEPREPFLLGVSSFIPAKNPGFAIETIARLPEPRPPLVWCANYADPVLLSAETDRARRLGVSLEVRVMARDDEVVSLMRRALALIYTPTLEPFGYVPVEAASTGLPVIYVPEGGVRESMRPGVTGIEVEPRPEAAAQALADLIAAPELRQRLSRSARAEVLERWTLPQAGDRLEAALARLLDPHSSP